MLMQQIRPAYSIRKKRYPDPVINILLFSEWRQCHQETPATPDLYVDVIFNGKKWGLTLDSLFHLTHEDKFITEAIHH